MGVKPADKEPEVHPHAETAAEHATEPATTGEHFTDHGPLPSVAAGSHATGPSAGEQAFAAHDKVLPWAATVTGKAPSTQGAQIAADLKTRMKTKYGARPHMFNGVVEGGNPLEKQMRAALPGVVAHLNQVAAQLHLPFRFTEAELATNFLTEGGYLLLESPDVAAQLQAGAHFSGFGALGIDTFATRRNELMPWMSQDLATWSADPANAETQTNEKGQQVHSIQIRDVAQGVEANGVMFADARRHFSHDAAHLGIDVHKLPHEAWFFWTTVYYNSGEGTGLKLLKQHGIDYWKQPWRKADDANQFGTNPKYNASWRTSTWDYMRQTEGDNLEHAEQHEAPAPQVH